MGGSSTLGKTMLPASRLRQNVDGSYWMIQATGLSNKEDPSTQTVRGVFLVPKPRNRISLSYAWIGLVGVILVQQSLQRGVDRLRYADNREDKYWDSATRLAKTTSEE